jgi:toxin CcdB
MQHDVFVNPGARTRAAFPFVAELQANVAEGRERIVAPMAPVTGYFGAAGRQTPAVRHDGEAYYLVIPLMSSLPRSRLSKPVGSVRQYRDDIVRAIDWLFTGI